jgi:hypothetical protein
MKTPDLPTIREIARLAWKNEKTVQAYYRWQNDCEEPRPRAMTIAAIEHAIKELNSTRGKVR